MNTNPEGSAYQNVVPFERNMSGPEKRIRTIGNGSLGGKAQGLVVLSNILSSNKIESMAQMTVGVPDLTVICTDVFDAFLAKNDLEEFQDSDQTDDQIAHAFQSAELPFHILGDLRALVEQIRIPIAVRSSSLLEDAAFQPFAGIYETKMIPNHQFDPDIRFQKLVQAIKFVYASTYFKAAKSYRQATHHDHRSEKMAVILQNVHGSRYHLRYYPELSGVARSYNYYPVGRAKPEDGVVNLALGLGKTIVDGGTSWSYSPAYPRIGPPYGSINELLKNSQRDFWAINLGTPLVYDPIRETEYLVLGNLAAAEWDGTLKHLCSTYDPQSDRLNPGVAQPGPRALTFAPILQLNYIPLNSVIKEVLELCINEFQRPVEIEFALTFSPPSLGLLQVRPMIVSSDEILVDDQDLVDPGNLAASEKALGNGQIDDIRDIVYVMPEQFSLENTRQIAGELDKVNQYLVNNGKPYLLIVFGRLGSSDPWLGIPVNWGQISGTRVIIETYQDNFSVDLSQGSHFFHNLTSLGVCYLSVPRTGGYKIDWEWLQKQEEIQRTQYVRHVQLAAPLQIRIDGKTSRGAVRKPEG